MMSALERVALDICPTCLYAEDCWYRVCQTPGCAFAGSYGRALAHEVKLGHHLTPEDSRKFIELVQAAAAHLRDDHSWLGPSAVRLREALHNIAGYDLAAVGGVGASTSPDAPGATAQGETFLGPVPDRRGSSSDAPTALADVGGTGEGIAEGREGHPDGPLEGGVTSHASGAALDGRIKTPTGIKPGTSPVPPTSDVGGAGASSLDDGSGSGPGRERASTVVTPDAPIAPASHALPATPPASGVSTTPPAAGASGGGAPRTPDVLTCEDEDL